MNWTRTWTIRIAVWFLLAMGTFQAISPARTNALRAEEARPNVILIYADDLGYGDLGCYGATEIPTPNMDRLAKEGLRFTQGYATAATCTPSRYSLLTGEYAWRQKGTGILPGNASLIIKPGRTTLASIFRDAGYRTGVVGKWHLGLGNSEIDWNGAIAPGPRDVGFDESFIMAATGDRVPCVYVRNEHVVGLEANDPITVSYGKPIEGVPTGKSNPEMLKMKPSHGHDMSIVNGISRIGYMKGGEKARWKDEDMAATFTQESVSFIESNAKKPFFLFFALHDPHVPRVPHPDFVGRTNLGARGDAIVQADWCIGEVLKKLDQLGIADNTMVILTGDNGPVLDDGYQDDAVEKQSSHKPAGELRGGKYSKFEAGTRVPWIVRWPAKTKPGTSSQVVSQVDLIASFGEMLGVKVPSETAPDSEPHFASLIDPQAKGRDHVIQQGTGGLAIRVGDWKLIEGAAGPAKNQNTNTETGNRKSQQLYDLSSDVGERKDLASEFPEKVSELQRKLDLVRGK